MALSMTRPTKHPKSGVYRVRLVVPVALRAIVGKGELIASLRTKDCAEAKQRFPSVLARLEAVLQAARIEASGRAPRLPAREIDALAGEVYRSEVAAAEEDPGTVAVAEAHGLTLQNSRAAFRNVPPTKPPVVSLSVALFALGSPRSARGGRVTLPIRPGDITAKKISADVVAHNTFAATWRVTGCLPPRWRRLFYGDWGLHGRWYAAGADGVYQVMPEAERIAGIRMNGKPAAEIDIKAAHLSILAALVGEPLDTERDPYEVPGVSRDAAKRWVVATLGKGSPVQRVPRGAELVFGRRPTTPRTRSTLLFPFHANLDRLDQRRRRPVRRPDKAAPEAQCIPLGIVLTLIFMTLNLSPSAIRQIAAATHRAGYLAVICTDILVVASRSAKARIALFNYNAFRRWIRDP